MQGHLFPTSLQPYSGGCLSEVWPVPAAGAGCGAPLHTGCPHCHTFLAPGLGLVTPGAGLWGHTQVLFPAALARGGSWAMQSVGLGLAASHVHCPVKASEPRAGLCRPRHRGPCWDPLAGAALPGSGQEHGVPLPRGPALCLEKLRPDRQLARRVKQTPPALPPGTRELAKCSEVVCTRPSPRLH